MWVKGDVYGGFYCNWSAAAAILVHADLSL